MTTTDTDALEERLWEAVAEVRDQHPRVFNDAPTDDVVAAVLPIVAEEVRKAKAEALREAAREEFQFSPNVHYQGIRAHERLVKRAYRIEAGDSNEHR